MSPEPIVRDVACPECGFDGPHVVFEPEAPDEPTMAECGDTDCCAEFVLAPPVRS